jgi:hypothetical protein
MLSRKDVYFQLKDGRNKLDFSLNFFTKFSFQVNPNKKTDLKDPFKG